MATATISAEYQDDALDFAFEMAENGHECSFGTQGAGVDRWNPPTAYAETGTANVFPSEWTVDFSGDVQADDHMYFVGATVDVEACTHMVDADGDLMKIIKTKAFKPDGVNVIYYEIQVR